MRIHRVAPAVIMASLVALVSTPATPVRAASNCFLTGQSQDASLPTSNRYDFAYSGSLSCTVYTVSITMTAYLMESVQLSGGYTQIDSVSNSRAGYMTDDLSKSVHVPCGLGQLVYVYAAVYASVLETGGGTLNLSFTTEPMPVICDATPGTA
jgi:hypothetical protein